MTDVAHNNDFQHVEIETIRLVIRVFRPEDITSTYLSALNDAEIVGLTEARHRKWDYDSAASFVIKSTNVGESLLLGVFLKSGDEPIGNIRLFNFHAVHHRAELSFLFYDKKRWGNGYATEALDRTIEYAFEDLGLHRVHADFYESNAASRRIFEKLGFKCEGRYADHFFVNNSYQDSIRVAKIGAG
jgi:[ribosomal protein S5]-alanine N-acetyltransferase